MKDIYNLLDGKWEDGTRPKDIYSNYISDNPSEYVEKIIKGLASEKKRIQSGCAELASLSSEKNPELFYNHISLFLNNLTAKEPMLRWEAVCVIGNLSCIDKDNKILAHLPTLYNLLSNKSIVLQGHTVLALSKYANAKPDQAQEILEKLTLSKDYFPNNRVGYLIDAMEYFINNNKLIDSIITFINSCADRNINSVTKKAKKILMKVEKKSQ